jgi:IS5 family transposase
LQGFLQFSEKPCKNMIGKNKQSGQMNFLYQTLKDQLNPRNPLYQLTGKIDWGSVDADFAEYYIDFGRPAKPVRLMVSLLILKQLHNLSDESVVERWVENPYFQYFSGETHFQWSMPCDPSDLVHFRHRVGKEGIEKIFRLSVQLQGKDARQKSVSIDTTVQEKNITFPTDLKLAVRIIAKCRSIAEKEDIELRQSYKRIVKEHILNQRFKDHPKNKKKAMASARKVKTIAGRLVRELGRKLPVQSAHRTELGLFRKVLSQTRQSKNKVYSLHEPDVSCIAKGKDHKKYEFGSKVSFAITKTTNVIVSVVTFKGNPYDGGTLKDTLDFHERITGLRAKEATVDRGYRGRKMVDGTIIYTPSPPKPKDSAYRKQQARVRFRRRAAIEPIFGHAKQDHRMARNYLKRFIGDEINALMAASAFNFRRWLRKVKLLPSFLSRWLAQYMHKTIVPLFVKQEWTTSLAVHAPLSRKLQRYTC